MEKKDHSGLAITSLVLGIIGMLAWFLPICGFPIAIVGLVLGIVGKDSSKHGLAVAGIVMTIISLILTIINGTVGVYMGLTGWFN